MLLTKRMFRWAPSKCNQRVSLSLFVAVLSSAAVAAQELPPPPSLHKDAIVEEQEPSSSKGVEDTLEDELLEDEPIDEIFEDDKVVKEAPHDEKNNQSEKENISEEQPTEGWKSTDEIWRNENESTRKVPSGLVKKPLQCRKVLEKSGVDAALECAEEVDKKASHPFTLELKLLAGKQQEPGVSPGTLWKRVVNTGMAEAVAAGAFVGGVGGFLGAATISATFRIDDAVSNPMLVASPAVGVLTGIAVTTGISLWAGNRPGESALLSSLAVQGLVHGILLQTSFFPLETDIWMTPLRFASVFGVMGGAVIGGGLAGRLLPIEDGDVGMANSAAFWIPAVLFPISAQLSFFGSSFTLPALELASAAAFVGTLLFSPLLPFKRPATLLIDLGGAAGFFFGAVVLSGLGGGSPGILLGGTMLAGVAAGTGATVGLHLLLDGKDPFESVVDYLQEKTQVEKTALVPTLLAPIGGRSAQLEPTKLHPGLLFSGRF